MTDGKTSGQGSPGGTGLLKNPGTNKLVEELGKYAEARLEHMLTGVGNKVGDAANRIGSAQVGPGPLVHALGKGGKLLGGQVASQAKGTAAHAKDAVTDKIKEATGQRHGASHGGGGKSITIIEDIDVGVPVREAYDQWTQFTEFGRFTKGVVSVEQKDDTTTQWQVKIAKASRAWTGTITEQVPDERIAWTSEGAKGTTRGVVTFHPVAENLTKVLLVLDYFPKGLVEKTANVWRAQGRRTRLDLKLFRKFVMLRGEATGGWRGEIREGEVVRGPDEAEEEDRETRGEERDRPGDEDEGEEAQPEDRYDERDEGGRGRSKDEPRDEDEEDEDEDEDQYDDYDEEDEYEDEDEEDEDEGPEDRDDEETPAESRRRSR
ncbi:SRPBCC family protein [Streptomyces sp. NPDC052023]|uniref:SRPBCC family protein n=1 Tax=Streptomyces sp. NPDC052023 TaxID=3365681 RepID=UPI0037D1A1A8